jgi:enoyl-CoA hydratase/carnithine racemase
MVKMMKEWVDRWSNVEAENSKVLRQVLEEKKLALEEKKLAQEEKKQAKEDKRQAKEAMKQAMEEMKQAKEQALDAKIKMCEDMALECGASPDNIEFFFACATIVRDEYNREFFCNIPTPEASLVFLKRWCQMNNMY